MLLRALFVTAAFGCVDNNGFISCTNVIRRTVHCGCNWLRYTHTHRERERELPSKVANVVNIGCHEHRTRVVVPRAC